MVYGTSRQVESVSFTDSDLVLLVMVLMLQSMAGMVARFDVERKQ